jgi:ribosomal-protein-alanine N-acetyltransferase
MKTDCPGVRPGGPADLQTIAEIERRSSANPWSLSQFLSSSLSDNQHSLVLDAGRDGVVGFLVYQRILDEATLMNIAIDPDRRGRGYAGQLLRALLEYLRREGAARCLLEVRVGNAAAIALYRRHGFVDDGLRRDYYPAAVGREDALLMSCNLETQI